MGASAQTGTSKILLIVRAFGKYILKWIKGGDLYN